MLPPSSPPAQAASATGSIRIAACVADIPKCNSFSVVCPKRRRRPSIRPDIIRAYRPSSNPRPPAAEMELASGKSNRGQLLLKNSAGPPPLGKQWRGPGLVSAGRGGATWSSHARGLALAALGGGGLLDRRLRRLMRLDRAHLLAGAMMASMLDMMAAHLRVGVHGIRLYLRVRLHLRSFSGRRLRGLAGTSRHDGCGNDGSCEQRRGNCLQHGRLLFQKGSRDGRTNGRARRLWDDLRFGALNPS